MNAERFQQITARYAHLKVVVAGDFCLDRYLHLDPAIQDHSRETDLPISQVIRTRSLPGGAAAVLADLAALGVGRVAPVGFLGRDGAGFEVNEALAALGVDTAGLERTETRPTPAFIKPVVDQEGAAPRELSRFDVFPREPLTEEAEHRLLERVAAELKRCDALIVSDYGEIGKEGIVTGAVRAGLLKLAAARPEKVFFADSRLSAGDFPGFSIKPNAREAGEILGRELGEASPLEELSAEMEGKIKIVKVNVDESQEIAQRYGVRSIPTIGFFRGGEPVGSIVGAYPKAALQQVIEEVQSKATQDA